MSYTVERGRLSLF